MGVPAFYRWLSEKYGKTVADMVEKRANVVGGTVMPVNLFEDNPNGVEYDALYVDLNGLIHPCSHPEDREAPKTEEEMYMNVTMYLDRLMSAVRPRRLLYLAIDGVAPRAKMNQQRSRRFRAAQDAVDRKKLADEVVAEMVALGHEPPESHEAEAWDSNVITPGTEFMYRLSNFLRYYILEKMNNHPYWKTIKVVFSDANEPGEGEHKIMGYIRAQRTQEGYDPNQHHILHGLDADLIMLALATHEAYFSILREKVTFGGRKGEEKPQVSEAQRLIDAQWIQDGAKLSSLKPQEEWVFMKPLQVLHIHVLREYLEAEFSVLKPIVSFGYDLERIIDDFIFLCFFVGNDFLPHLPSLDIRDGALDFLMECYREVLPSLGDYITSPGGNINLRQADVILAKVGEIEDQIFLKKKNAEDVMERRRAQQKNFRSQNDFKNKQQQPPEGLVALNMPGKKGGAPTPTPPPPASAAAGTSQTEKNQQATGQIEPSLLGKRAVEGNGDEDAELFPSKAAMTDTMSSSCSVEDNGAPDTDGAVISLAVPVGGGDDEEEDDDDPPTPAVIAVKLSAADKKEELKKRMKEREQASFDKNKETVVDTIKFHEPGWKDRYYGDKHKKENIAEGGGLGNMCVQYIKGLCWVLKYYYEGVPSWSWYYPFHYAPFASDLINIDTYEGLDFELATPFRPVEQLLAVLPANSAPALPPECRWLMTDPESPIIDLYDPNIPIDPNGKHLPWLWILLLPFIEASRVHEAFKGCEHRLKLEERRRNALSGSLVYIHKDDALAQEASQEIGYKIGRETDVAVRAFLDGDSAAGPSATISTASTESVEGGEKEKQKDEHLFDPFVGKGMSGYVYPPPPTCFVSMESSLTSPTDDDGFSYLPQIVHNKVQCYGYKLPPLHPHESKILPGVNPPTPQLSGFDLMPRRPPRLNRNGFNMLDILNANRAAQQQGNYSYQAQHQHNSFFQHSNGGRGHHQHMGSNGGGGGYHHRLPPQQILHNAQQQQQQQHHQFGGGGQYGGGYSNHNNHNNHQQSHQQPYIRQSQYQDNNNRHYRGIEPPPRAPERHDHNYSVINPNSRDPNFNRKATLLTGDTLGNVERRDNRPARAAPHSNPQQQQQHRPQQHIIHNTVAPPGVYQAPFQHQHQQQYHQSYHHQKPPQYPQHQHQLHQPPPRQQGFAHSAPQQNPNASNYNSMDAIRAQLLQTHQQQQQQPPPQLHHQQQQQQQYGSSSAYGNRNNNQQYNQNNRR